MIGQEVPLSTSGRMRLAGVRDEDTLVAAIEQSVDARLLGQTLESERVHFAHALVREVLYEGISPVRRRIWHRRSRRRWWQEAHPDPDAVAHHFQQAGDARAISWPISPVNARSVAYAWLTASDRFEAAVMLMNTYDADAGARGWLLVRVARLRRYTDPRQGIACLDIAAELAKKSQ